MDSKVYVKSLKPAKLRCDMS